MGRAKSRWLALTGWLPITKRTLVKVLLVLAYAQMLIQQMDNKHHLQDQAGLLAAPPSSADFGSPSGRSCCSGGDSGAKLELFGESRQPAPSSLIDSTEDEGGQLSGWFNCMWTSAKACSGMSQQQQQQPSWMAKLVEFLRGALGKLLVWTLELPLLVYRSLLELLGLLQAARLLWLARWRSPIIQRLGQSMLVQLCYIGSLVLDDSARDGASADI